MTKTKITGPTGKVSVSDVGEGDGAEEESPIEMFHPFYLLLFPSFYDSSISVFFDVLVDKLVFIRQVTFTKV